MFVCYVKFVDDGDPAAVGFRLVDPIRLQALNDCLGFGFNVPKPTTTDLIFELLWGNCDRELNGSLGTPGHFNPNVFGPLLRQRKHDVIETRSQVVNHVANEQTDAFRRIDELVEQVDVLSAFGIQLADDAIWIGCDESFNRNCECLQMLVCPLELPIPGTHSLSMDSTR